jgi:hypothetical protein
MAPKVIRVGKTIRVDSNDSIYDGTIESISPDDIVRVIWTRNGSKCHRDVTKDGLYWVLEHNQPLKAY